jgi:hypothetical protein
MFGGGVGAGGGGGGVWLTPPDPVGALKTSPTVPIFCCAFLSFVSLIENVPAAELVTAMYLVPSL